MSYHKKAEKYEAYISRDGKKIYLGLFISAEEGSCGEGSCCQQIIWGVRQAEYHEGIVMRKLKKYKQTRFMAKGSHYDKEAADYAVAFIESLCHTKGKWAGKKFELIDWQEQIVRDLFGTIKEKWVPAVQSGIH